MFYDKKCATCGKSLEVGVNMYFKQIPGGKGSWLCVDCCEKELRERGRLREVDE